MNILVTAIGSMSADCVISNLNKYSNVYGCDIYPKEWHIVSTKCEKVYRSPLAIDQENYINFICSICEENNIKYIFPLTDVEVDTLNLYRNRLSSYDITVCMSDGDILKLCRNKALLNKFFKDDEMVASIPTITSYDEIDFLTADSDFPFFAKPIDGRSSEGICFLNNIQEIQNILSTEKYIVQKYIKGNIFTVDFIRNNETKSHFSIPREELLRTKNGAGLTVRMLNDPKLSNLAEYIGKKLNINGCVNMEFIKNNEVYYLIDINPRFSAGVAYTELLGYDIVKSHLNCFTGRDILPPITYKDQLMSKGYFEQVLGEL